jgi:hypothetical protein
MLRFLPNTLYRLSRTITIVGILTCICQSDTWAQGLALSPAPTSSKAERKAAEKPPESSTSSEESPSPPAETASNSAPPDPTERASTPPALEPSTSTVTPNQIMPVELGPEALHQEMNLLKNLLKSEGDGAAENETLIIGEALKAPSRYHQYLLKAADISEELLSVREELLTDGGTMSLQQLGALAQDFSRQYDSFRNQLTPSEQKFQSAMLIETAVKSLNEAIDYWRTSNHFRRWGHGNYTDKIDDTQILQLKLQTANTAIGNLSGIVKTRQIFSRSFDTDSN